MQDNSFPRIASPLPPITMGSVANFARDPIQTMRQVWADHGEVGESIVGRAAEGRAVLDEVTAAGVDLADVFEVLEDEGVEKFIVSWNELVTTVEKAIH